MPITPLHFGVLAPINHFVPKKVSNASFILVNVWMDAASIVYALFGIGGYDHGPGHSLLGAAALATLVAIPGILSKRWVLGAYIGGFSHVALDALVHSDMHPFLPLQGNPFYFGMMEGLSLVLLPFMCWLIFQYVLSLSAYIRKSPTSPIVDPLRDPNANQSNLL